jgi:hypothetical protein
LSNQFDGTFFNTKVWQQSSGYIALGTNNTERMRIASSGALLKGKTIDDVTSENGLSIDTSGIMFTAMTTGQNTYHVYSRTSGGYTFYVSQNGGVYNFSGNNVNISDEKVKENIEIAGSYLEKICNIPVKLFNYKNQENANGKTLGVIAQDVLKVAPELVNSDGFGEKEKDQEPLLAIYQTDLQYALMKCIQEQQAIITDLKSRIEALEVK